MSPTIAFVFATSMEADPFIAAINAQPILTAPWSVYQAGLADQSAIIIITGMGMEAAKNASNYIIENYSVKMVVNCGVAGSLCDDFTVGDIVNVKESRVSENGLLRGDVCRLAAHSSSLTGYSNGVLLTVDNPVFDAELKENLSELTNLVDMEGGIVARVCEQHNIPCQLIKIISDNATKRIQLKKNLAKVSEKLACNMVFDLKHIFSQELTA